MKNETALKATTSKDLFSQDNVKNKFKELLGKKAQGFLTSVLQIISSNDLLAKADPYSIYNVAVVAAVLDLPLNNNLGFAYIIPYGAKQADGSFKQVAQFQMGYKGFIQLAQRTGLFKTISASPIYEGQLVESNPLTGYKFDFSLKKSDMVIGYAGYFSLLNGFEKTLFLTVDELKKHGKNYSQTFRKGYGLWESNFDAMATKTVIKLLLSKFAPLSIEMQKAVITDQAIINDEEATDVSYVDNSIDEATVDKEGERVRLMIEDAKTLEELESLQEHVEVDQLDLYKTKEAQLKKKK